MEIRTITLDSETATIALAEAIASRARAGDTLLLTGPLGAGKSTFARAFIRARAADPVLDVPSPTFTLAQTYELDPPVTHFDLWRLSGPDDVAETGLDAALSGIALIEWPDRLGTRAPRDALAVMLEWGENDTRVARFDGTEALLARLLP